MTLLHESDPSLLFLGICNSMWLWKPPALYHWVYQRTDSEILFNGKASGAPVGYRFKWKVPQQCVSFSTSINSGPWRGSKPCCSAAYKSTFTTGSKSLPLTFIPPVSNLSRSFLRHVWGCWTGTQSLFLLSSVAPCRLYLVRQYCWDKGSLSGTEVWGL